MSNPIQLSHFNPMEDIQNRMDEIKVGDNSPRNLANRIDQHVIRPAFVNGADGIKTLNALVSALKAEGEERMSILQTNPGISSTQITTLDQVRRACMEDTKKRSQTISNLLEIGNNPSVVKIIEKALLPNNATQSSRGAINRETGEELAWAAAA